MEWSARSDATWLIRRSAEGVAEWWIDADLGTARRALGRLVKSGYLAKIGEDDRVHYHLRQQPRTQ
jgi:hypothetical protein